jgi:hypothetical protein
MFKFSKLFSGVALPFYIPTSAAGVIPFFAFLPALDVSLFFFVILATLIRGSNISLWF